MHVSLKGELGELADAINAMAEGLQRLEQLRRNMITDVAHELRTLLSNVRYYLEALRDGVVESTPEMIVSVYEEAMLLSRLVDDLQELVLAEVGQLNLVCQPVEIREVVEKAIHALNAQATKKEASFQVCLLQDLPLVFADVERTGQMLRNLLMNAVINTPCGGWIRVEARAVNSQVEVSVQDNG